MKTVIERRWTVVAFNHPTYLTSVYYRKGIKNLERAVSKAIEAGANLISIRGFDYEITYCDKFELEEGQQELGVTQE